MDHHEFDEGSEKNFLLGGTLMEEIYRRCWRVALSQGLAPEFGRAATNIDNVETVPMDLASPPGRVPLPEDADPSISPDDANARRAKYQNVPLGSATEMLGGTDPPASPAPTVFMDPDAVPARKTEAAQQEEDIPPSEAGLKLTHNLGQIKIETLPFE